jgi:hypothetical protein
MEWAVNSYRAILQTYAGIAAVALASYLAFGRDPMAARVAMVVVALFFACFGFFGMRLVLGIQVKLHGMKPFIRTACTWFFYFFAVGGLWSITIVAARPDIAVVGVVGLFGWSAGALMTYVRYRAVAPKGASNLTTG